MSSNQTHHHPTFWCHDCDMSVHLLSSSAAAAPPSLCPHCRSPDLELMDAATDSAPSFLDSPSFRRFFLPLFPDLDCDDESSDSLFDSILPTIKIAPSLVKESEILCAICKELFVVDAEAKLLPCDHLFHPECILPWLDSDHNSCPLCRFQLSKLADVSSSESSSSSSSVECNAGVEVGFTNGDGVDCGFPDVGVLSSFLPSHF